MNIPLEDWSGASATNELHETIKEFKQASHRSSQRMLGLTWAIVFLTLVMFLAVAAQVFLALLENATFFLEKWHEYFGGQG